MYEGGLWLFFSLTFFHQYFLTVWNVRQKWLRAKFLSVPFPVLCRRPRLGFCCKLVVVTRMVRSEVISNVTLINVMTSTVLDRVHFSQTRLSKVCKPCMPGRHCALYDTHLPKSSLDEELGEKCSWSCCFIPRFQRMFSFRQYVLS